jgi:hypothetical protein
VVASAMDGGDGAKWRAIALRPWHRAEVAGGTKHVAVAVLVVHGGWRGGAGSILSLGVGSCSQGGGELRCIGRNPTPTLLVPTTA